MSTAATEMHIACINCTSAGGRSKNGAPAGWTRVREFPAEEDDDTTWFTHVGYCPNPECQLAATEEAESAGLLFV